MSEAYDELHADMSQWKRDSDAAHATIDRGPFGYRSVLDRGPTGPAPALPESDPAFLAAQQKAILDERISSLLLGLIAARKLAQSIGDPRAARLVDAISAMPGDGR